ncbi:MAG: carboxy terminal-processing peptidase [Verrucomicrobiota bacterium]
MRTTSSTPLNSCNNRRSLIRLRTLASPRLLLLVLTLACGISAAKDAPERGDAFERLIARTVAMRLPKMHYSHQKLNDDVSEQFFKEYFNLLDPQRSTFLAEDLESFAHVSERLDNLLQMGRIHFAYEVYELFLKRVKERAQYVESLLDNGVDLTKEEFYVPDRSEADWPADKRERETLWRKQVKNLLLTYSLIDSAEDEESDDDAQEDNDKDAKEDEASNADANDANNAKDESDADTDESGNGETDAEEDDPKDTAAKPATTQKTPEERVLNYFNRQQTLFEDRSSIEVLELFLLALAQVYDPHSSYMAPDTEEDFDIHMKLSLEGIGALLTTEDGYVKIADIIPGGPAQRDGRLQPGDRIIEVSQDDENPVDVINMPLRKVVDLIRGPKGSKVVLTVIEAEKGLGAVPVHIDLVRDEVKLKAQEAKAELLPIDECGYPVQAEDDNDNDNDENQPANRILLISLPSFYRDFEGEKNRDQDFKSSTRDVRRLIEKHATEDDLDGVVLDLRGNGGGSLTEAVDLAGLFFTKGPVVQARYSNGEVRVLRDKDGETVFSGPLTILVDRRSASASEIVAAALQDMGRAVIVGTEATHGKGTIQTLYHLEREFQNLPAPFNEKPPGSLKITVGKFYRINGEATQLRGVEPDIVFPDYSDHLELGERSLSNPMPWSQIDPVKYSRDDSVSPYLERLRQRSRDRRKQSEAYAERMEKINFFGERQKQKRVPLQREARTEYHRQQEEFSERFADKTPEGILEPSDDEDSDQDEESQNIWRLDDYVLVESGRILADLIRLRADKKLCDIERQVPLEEELANSSDRRDEDRRDEDRQDEDTLPAKD